MSHDLYFVLRNHQKNDFKRNTSDTVLSRADGFPISLEGKGGGGGGRVSRLVGTMGVVREKAMGG